MCHTNLLVPTMWSNFIEAYSETKMYFMFLFHSRYSWTFELIFVLHRPQGGSRLEFTSFGYPNYHLGSNLASPYKQRKGFLELFELINVAQMECKPYVKTLLDVGDTFI